MPVITRFDGIVIKMYFSQSEHDPPHIHIKYAEYSAVVSIKTGDILEGIFPTTQMNKVREWTKIHRDELIDMWNTQNFSIIELLK